MKKTFVARTREGAEYMFITSSAFYVTPKKAQAVADVLNREKYKLLPGQVWRVFTDDGEWTSSVLYRGVIRKNGISLYEIA